jgi:hypothetical protein
MGIVWICCDKKARLEWAFFVICLTLRYPVYWNKCLVNQNQLTI